MASNNDSDDRKAVRADSKYIHLVFDDNDQSVRYDRIDKYHDIYDQTMKWMQHLRYAKHICVGMQREREIALIQNEKGQLLSAYINDNTFGPNALDMFMIDLFQMLRACLKCGITYAVLHPNNMIIRETKKSDQHDLFTKFSIRFIDYKYIINLDDPDECAALWLPQLEWSYARMVYGLIIHDKDWKSSRAGSIYFIILALVNGKDILPWLSDVDDLFETIDRHDDEDAEKLQNILTIINEKKKALLNQPSSNTVLEQWRQTLMREELNNGDFENNVLDATIKLHHNSDITSSQLQLPLVALRTYCPSVTITENSVSRGPHLHKALVIDSSLRCFGTQVDSLIYTGLGQPDDIRKFLAPLSLVDVFTLCYHSKEPIIERIALMILHPEVAKPGVLC